MDRRLGVVEPREIMSPALDGEGDGNGDGDGGAAGGGGERLLRGLFPEEVLEMLRQGKRVGIVRRHRTLDSVP